MATNSIGGIFGSDNNNTVNLIDEYLFKHSPGKIAISNKNSDKASAVIITDDGVVITNSNTTGGLGVRNNSIDILGTLYITSKGENIKKGEYSENSKNSKIFTYTETVLMESIPKEVLSAATGATTGLNTSQFTMDGVVPIVTDISAGPTPHLHTITMKHVHRIEPPYLYRVPSSINIIKGALGQLQEFFQA